MNSRAHLLSLFSALCHLIIGIPEILRIGPRYLPASWAAIYGFLPDGWEWLWPGLFVLTGIVAAFGAHCPRFLRIGFLLSSLIYFIWATVGVYSWHLGTGGNIPGSAANYFVAGCAWVLAHYVTLGVKSDAINVQVAVLGEVVQQAEDIRQANGG